MSHKSIQSYLFIGKTGSGKTYTSKQILENELSHIKKENRWLISPTAKPDMDKTLLPYFDIENIENEYSEEFLIDVLLELIKTERKEIYDNHYYKINDKLEKVKLNKKTPPPYEEYLIYIDDCIEHLKTGNSVKGISALITKARHYGIHLIITSQFYTAVSPIIRSNIKQLFIFGCNNKERKKINDEHSLFQKPQHFDIYFQNLTKDLYNSVKIDYNKPVQQIFDDNKITPKEFKKDLRTGKIKDIEIL